MKSRNTREKEEKEREGVKRKLMKRVKTVLSLVIYKNVTRQEENF